MGALLMCMPQKGYALVVSQVSDRSHGELVIGRPVQAGAGE